MNNFKKDLMEEIKYGIFLTNVNWSDFIEILARNKYDFIVIDTEHGSYGYDQVQSIVRMAKLLAIHPVIRVSDKQYHLVSRALDMGADSIMMPTVETANDVENLIRWAKFPPVGKRGAGNYSILLESNKSKFIQETNNNGLIVIQIETKKGVENLDEILKNPVIDVIFIGPMDLSISLGTPGDFQNIILTQAIEQIIMKSKMAGKNVGILCNPEQAPFFVKKGVNLIAIGVDVSILQSATQMAMEKARE